MSHPFGDLLTQYRARKHGLSQAKLAEAIGYDHAVIARMCQGKKDLTGPSGRDRVVRIIGALRDFGALSTLDEANALLDAGGMPPLYSGQPVEAALIATLATPYVSRFTSLASHLPTPLAPLIGREGDVAVVKQKLLNPDVRLVTLLGPPGVGKTRLVIEVARQLNSAFDDGVWFVVLAPITDPNLIIPAIAMALGVGEAAGKPILERVKHVLQGRALLLVLDNFEQVLDAAPTVVELLLAAPQLKMLLTSRAALRISGEHEYYVPPLALPDPDHFPPPNELLCYAGIKLFVERAQAAQPAFALSHANAAAVSGICIRLDGLPLPIELAAARVNLFSPQVVLARLDHRLTVLTGGVRDLPSRQRTLRDTIDWSYELLRADEQKLLARLGVFAGGWTLDAAAAIASDGEQDRNRSDTAVADMIESLLHHSLVQHRTDDDGERRFWLLETIREYALERLETSGEADTVRHGHARFFTELAERVEAELHGAAAAQWLHRLGAELDNVRAALGWCLHSGNTDLGLRLAGAMGHFWLSRGPLSEGLTWLRAFLGRAPQEELQQASARAKAFVAAGQLAHDHGDVAEARQLYDQALALYRTMADKRGIAATLLQLAQLFSQQQDYDAKLALIEESLALYREVNDKWGIASCLFELGTHATTKTSAPGEALLEKALALFRELGDQIGIANVLAAYGFALRFAGEYAKATALFEESLTLRRELGHNWDIGLALINLGYIALARSKISRATALFEQSVALAKRNDYLILVAWPLRGLGSAAWLQGDDTLAAARHTESLLLYRQSGDKWGMAECLEGLALVACRPSLSAPQADSAKRIVRGVRLFGAMEALREITRNGRPIAETAWVERAVHDARATLGEHAFKAAWAEGRAMTLAQAIDYALAAEEDA